MEEKQRQYVLLGLALLFLMLAVFYYLYVMPVLNQKREAEIQLQQKKAELELATKQKKEADTRPPQEKLRQIAELFPVKSYDEQLVKEFGKLQSISKIAIEDASFEENKEINAADLAKEIVSEEVEEKTADIPKEQAPKVTRAELEKYLPHSSIRNMKIKLSIKGEYKDVYRFVTEIQQMSRYLRVDKLMFKQKQEDDFKIPKEKGIEANLELTGYYAPQYASLLDKLPSVHTDPPSGKWDPTKYPVIEKEDVQPHS